MVRTGKKAQPSRTKREVKKKEEAGIACHVRVLINEASLGFGQKLIKERSLACIRIRMKKRGEQAGFN